MPLAGGGCEGVTLFPVQVLGLYLLVFIVILPIVVVRFLLPVLFFSLVFLALTSHSPSFLPLSHKDSVPPCLHFSPPSHLPPLYPGYLVVQVYQVHYSQSPHSDHPSLLSLPLKTQTIEH